MSVASQRPQLLAQQAGTFLLWASSPREVHFKPWSWHITIILLQRESVALHNAATLHVYRRRSSNSHDFPSPMKIRQAVSLWSASQPLMESYPKFCHGNQTLFYPQQKRLSRGHKEFCYVRPSGNIECSLVKLWQNCMIMNFYNVKIEETHASKFKLSGTDMHISTLSA